MIEAWRCLERTVRADYEVFRVRVDRRRSPRSGQEYTFHIIEAPDWVNIIPVTPEGRIVCVRQYRHGTDEVTLEIPGGVVDPGEGPEEAARREMREETGYDTDDLHYLGCVAPNPAIQNNRCHTYLARDVRLDGHQVLDGAEDIEVVLVDPAEVPELIVTGKISHALVVAVFYLYENARQRRDTFSVGSDGAFGAAS